ncbi:MAG: hypothetical protein N0E45_17015 [Candidatus Thiodiazotropha endolucinida]|nr:hypothetical protein [Candidatus Thiodiazotropha taylori]MCW4301339.1 hypothetical protein [Candidatus Thiodiazotropha endolucinida]
MLKWLGATSVRDGLNEPQRPYPFVTKDKVYNLWRDKNEVWHWSDMGCPAGKGKCGKEKLEGLGATRTIDDSSPSERPYLFAIDHNTSKVWSLWWDAMHMTWHWSDLGCPAGECGKKYNGLGDMMTNAMVRTTIDDDGFDIGNTRHPYVFVVEADDPEKVHYLRLLDKKQDKQIGTWKEARRKDRKRIIGVVSVLIHNGIIPVIVSEKKDSRISLEYLAPNDPDKWHGRDYDCSSCALHSAIPISGTHIPNGSGVIMYGYFGGLKEGGYFGEEFLPEFKTYSF